MAHRALPGLGVAGIVALVVAAMLPVCARVESGVALAPGWGRMLLQAARMKAAAAKRTKCFTPVKGESLSGYFF